MSDMKFKFRTVKLKYTAVFLIQYINGRTAIYGRYIECSRAFEIIKQRTALLYDSILKVNCFVETFSSDSYILVS